METNKVKAAAMDRAGELPLNERRAGERRNLSITITRQFVIPEGYALVPLEPNETMIHAAEDVPAPRPFGMVYRAMIAAAMQESVHGQSEIT